MAFNIRAVVGMNQDEYNAIEVKQDDVVYFVRTPVRWLIYIGDERVAPYSFEDFTSSQKAEIQSWAQEESEQNAVIATTKASEASIAAENAAQSEAQCSQYAHTASMAETWSQNAKEAETVAVKAAGEAQRAADSASNSMILSRSYTRGGTGKRQGENTDNAKFYMEEARKAAEEAHSNDPQEELP